MTHDHDQDHDPNVRLTRRHAIAASAAVAAATLASTRARAAQRPSAIQGGGGITGGGAIDAANGQIHFSLFGSRLTVEGEDEPVIFGSLHWVDEDAGFTFESTAIDAYGPPPDDENARELRGTVTDGDGEEHPFVLRATPGGTPGPGDDTLRLTIGEGAFAATPGATPASALTYEIEGPLAAGDLHLLSFDPNPS